jgi:hypothetical protein
MRSRGYTTQSFKPAYVKPQAHRGAWQGAQAAVPVSGWAGRCPRNSATRCQVADNLQIEEDQITRTEEWMASRSSAPAR